MGNRVKVAVITGDIQDSQYYDTFIPHYISDWEEIDEEQVDKVKKGLHELSRSVPVSQRQWVYKLIVAPMSQKGMVNQALEAYDLFVKKEDERKQRIEETLKKTQKQAVLKKKRAELKKTIKLLSDSANNKVIDALHAELKEVEKNLKEIVVS